MKDGRADKPEHVTPTQPSKGTTGASVSLSTTTEQRSSNYGLAIKKEPGNLALGLKEADMIEKHLSLGTKRTLSGWYLAEKWDLASFAKICGQI